MNEVARHRTARTYLYSVLLNLELDSKEMRLSTFLEMIDHFADHPEEYNQIIHDRYTSK